MALSVDLRPTTLQRLSLTPAMRMSLAVLRMPADQLLDEIAREAADNPLLVVEDNIADRPPFDLALETAAASVSAVETLVRQLAAKKAEPEVIAAAILLVQELDEDGYLDSDLAHLATEAELPLALLNHALALLQSCEPPGVGARNLRECLALQLSDGGMDPALATVVVGRLRDFAEGNWQALSRALGITAARAEDIAAILRGLSPTPFQPVAEPVLAVVPDLLVEVTAHGHVAVHLNPATHPRLSVLDLRGHRTTRGDFTGLTRRAQGLVAALAQRAETMLRVGRAIVAAQPAFFTGAVPRLLPLTRFALADELGLHPSTVSRALAGKSLMVAGLVHPLAGFFSRGLPGSEGEISAFEIQSRIRSLIASEDATQPLADGDICTHLKDEGVDIARRTVAKYRKCMRIPSSFERRRRNLSTRSRLARNGRGEISET